MDAIYDYIIVGAGFGGSVSALRLAEKGYKVLLLEAGRRYEDADFPKSSRSIKKWLFWPELGLHGIMRMSFFRDAFFMSGAGVGGGSLVYGNTLLTPPDSYYNDRQWASLADWKEDLAPHYLTAKRMLGVTKNLYRDHKDDLVYDLAKEMGREDTFHQTNVGVFFGEPNLEVKDPFFDGEGPNRRGCTFCGNCMVGCRVGAKNTLRKNYLWLAEKHGVTIIPETRVERITHSEEAYHLEGREGIHLFRKGKKVHYKAKGLVMSAGVLGTIGLLLKMKDKGCLPNLSDCLGDRVRTNSEAFTGVRTNDDIDCSSGIAITSGFYPDDSTHVELVRYGPGSDTIGMISTLLVGGGPPVIRLAKYTWQMFRHPINFWKSLQIKHWAKRNMILLVMQNRDNHMKLERIKRWYWPFTKRLTTVVKPGQSVPTYIPKANEVAERMAKKVGGFPVGSLPEILFNKSSTAHILGGAVIGKDKDCGVINARNEVFGYPNMYVIDGSMIPANLGVNPSLTITAMAELAMSHIPQKYAAEKQSCVERELAMV